MTRHGSNQPSNQAIAAHLADPGITAKDERFNWVVTLFILSVLIAAFVVVRAVVADRIPGYIININTGSDVGACESLLNAEMHDAAGVGKSTPWRRRFYASPPDFLGRRCALVVIQSLSGSGYARRSK